MITDKITKDEIIQIMRTREEIITDRQAVCVKAGKARTSCELTNSAIALLRLNNELSEVEQAEAIERTHREQTALDRIRQWVNSSHAHLSQAPGYARGYKEGIGIAKEIIRGILEECLGETEQG